MGGRSLKLGTVLGIRIGVSTSWFLILFLLLYVFTQSFQDTLGVGSTEAFAVAAAAVVLFFGSILLHELGHALAALREGIEVAGIDLFIFGGVMKMSREGASAGAMFRIAAAGPAVTLGIVVLGGGLAALLLGWSGVLDAAQLDARVGTSAIEQLLSLLVGLNVILLVFNLIPALPLDGGQILRSIVWAATGERSKGTRVAAVLGQGFSYVLMGYGAWLLWRGDTFGGIWSVGLGLMIGQGARGAAAQNAFSERLEGVTVADIMDADPVTIPAGLDAARASRTTSSATTAGSGSRSRRPTGASSASPTAPRSSTPPWRPLPPRRSARWRPPRAPTRTSRSTRRSRTSWPPSRCAGSAR
jgi:Zn-dependent protease